MAPEQAPGQDLDHRGDLFAVGIMLWEAIAAAHVGRPQRREIVRCLVLDEVPSLQACAPNVDPELAHICGKALAIDPGPPLRQWGAGSGRA